MKLIKIVGYAAVYIGTYVTVGMIWDYFNGDGFSIEVDNMVVGLLGCGFGALIRELLSSPNQEEDSETRDIERE
ncbi:hypothetical protein [Aureibacillus halotolerans]|uniref:Uncharacterized protein n=1 Tax=Aureibacillus halotolerans TaxID=1508390 RepID=A0A4R6U435_9BACI|nr:hypothetical protein [Aureibacillus halotolerans]TDQ41200.1 hypothetical protein EV213_104198 [Aureibacillus halotolerans]